ncbi:hypothetical protein RRG08_039150 [Elysia crispata]|uniref:Uncharacterized protein n=1 Tax=Elysia crispata TaxID=231223 RepID=A0AAE1AEQ4_9GAST|nr:hypothetical protein RRG08_039150 [Elysia crispata]
MSSGCFYKYLDICALVGGVNRITLSPSCFYKYLDICALVGGVSRITLSSGCFYKYLDICALVGGVSRITLSSGCFYKYLDICALVGGVSRITLSSGCFYKYLDICALVGHGRGPNPRTSWPVLKTDLVNRAPTSRAPWADVTYFIKTDLVIRAPTSCRGNRGNVEEMSMRMCNFRQDCHLIVPKSWQRTKSKNQLVSPQNRSCKPCPNKPCSMG